MDSGMALPSLPLAAATDSDGASATGFTVTISVLVTLLALVPLDGSESVAVADRFTVPVNSEAGVKASPVSCAAVSVYEPSPLSVPWLKLPPCNPEMRMVRLAAARSPSTCPALIKSTMALPSLPLAWRRRATAPRPPGSPSR
jgi:hypothetical protein